MSNQPAAHYTIDDIGTLDRVSFEAPIEATSTCSLAFWFFATSAMDMQVIVDISQKISVWLDAGRIYAGNNETTVFADYPDLNHWHQVVLNINEDSLFLYVDSNLVSSKTLSDPVKIPSNAVLRVGGYTDPAGGHFDHTFGRNGTGLVDDVRYYTGALEVDIINAFPPHANELPHLEISSEQAKFTAVTNKPEAFRFFLWDFDDGAITLGQQVTHTFAYAGEYTVQLRAVTHCYMESTTSLTVQVEDAQHALNPVPVFINGTEGYACFRIPSIVRTANGDLIAFAEGRVESCSDSTATIRLVCKHSMDNGQTWSALQVVASNVVNGREYVVQNSSPVLDESTGRIVVLYNKMQHNEWELSTGTGKSYIYAIFSDDHGATWHTETNITEQVQRTEWQVQRPTLGHAIQLRSGRLFFAGVFTKSNHSVFESQNYAFWSDDGGKTWTIGGIVETKGLNEATAVELENGDVMINSRAYRDEQPVGYRAVTVGRFTDTNTIEFEPTAYDDVLIDPAVQASMIRLSTSHTGKNRILFCNPNHPKARYNLTLRLSYDEGKTWPVSKTVHPGASAYSDLVIQEDMTIGVLYERGNQGGIVYVSLTLDWLTAGQDKLGKESR